MNYLRLLHMMNVRFSLLNMAQRILGVTFFLVKKAKKMMISKIFIWWVFCLNMSSIGWLNKYISIP
jgi:hypothetical protein